MAFCGSCGTELAPQARFCRKCGRPIPAVEPAPPPPPPVAAAPAPAPGETPAPPPAPIKPFPAPSFLSPTDPPSETTQRVPAEPATLVSQPQGKDGLPPAGDGHPLAGHRPPRWRRPLELLALLIVLAGAAAGTLVATGALSSAHARGSGARQPRKTSAVASKPATATTSAGGSAGASASTTASTQSTTTTNQAASSTTGPVQSGPAAAIRRHYADLNAGRYQQSFNLMTPSYRSANPNWISARTAADAGYTIVSIGPAQLGSGSAQVPVNFYARDRHTITGSNTECRHFQGTVEMVLIGGAWLYDPSGSSIPAGTVVPSSNPSCPA